MSMNIAIGIVVPIIMLSIAAISMPDKAVARIRDAGGSEPGSVP